MIRLSICVLTYNRAVHLTNCLQSIYVSRQRAPCEIEVCVSDNGSAADTERVVRDAQRRMPITYRRNARNLGIPRHFLNVVEMATGEFVWLLGDDDLLAPEALEALCSLIEHHRDVDFFYVNSYHLTAEYVLGFPQPFDTSKLPAGMTPFSSWPDTGAMPFLDLVDPKVSFDFLGGMFLAVFRRANWLAHADAISDAADEILHSDGWLPSASLEPQIERLKAIATRNSP